MSTDHINAELSRMIEMAREVARKNNELRQEVQSEQEAAEAAVREDSENLLTTMRGVQQRYEDETAARLHILNQAERIAGITPAPTHADPVAPPTGPTPPEGRDPLPGPRTARARAAAEAEAAAEAGAEARATARADATAGGGTPTTPTPVVRVFDVRLWGVLQWLLAGVGLIVSLLIAGATWGWLVDDVTGFARVAIATVWWIALAMTGFFGGGFIGSRTEEDG